jgi:[ribosomal protein S5]-alanine N-acetyltransferase
MGLLTGWRQFPDRDALKGTRVALRRPSMDDYAEWSDLRLVSRDFLEPWEPEWDHAELSKASFRNRIRRYQELREDDTAYPFFIWSLGSGHLVGAVTISNVRRGIAQSGTLGYWTGKPFARQGFMSEALEILAAYSFRDLRLHRLEAACLPHNQPSIGLLNKCEFEREGYAKAYLKIAGRWEDHVLFARVNARMG